MRRLLLSTAFSCVCLLQVFAVTDYPSNTAAGKGPGVPLLVKRMMAHLSAAEFSELTGHKLNLPQRLAYGLLRKRYYREMERQGLLQATDTLLLADGSTVTGFVLASKPGQVVYKTTPEGRLQKTNSSLLKGVRYAAAVKAFTQQAGETELPYDKNASASLWFGLAAIVSLFVPILNLLSPALAITAVVTGITGLSNIKKSNGTKKGKGRATAGIIMGSFYFLLLLVVVILFVTLLAGGGLGG